MEVTKQKESHLEIYKRYNKLYIALDCIIFGFDEGELKLLLIKRNFEPAKGQWSLIGEFMDEAESLDEAFKSNRLEGCLHEPALFTWRCQSGSRCTGNFGFILFPD